MQTITSCFTSTLWNKAEKWDNLLYGLREANAGMVLPTLLSPSVFLPGHDEASRVEGKMAAILQLSQYCTFRMDSISTVITEPGQPVSHCVGQQYPFWPAALLPQRLPTKWRTKWSPSGWRCEEAEEKGLESSSGEAEILKGPVELY